MGYYEPDVYGQPGNFGLELVIMLDEPGLSWEFNMFGVWIDAEGQLYYADDMGCSCPSPFENYTSRDSLAKASKKEIMAEAKFWRANAEQQMELFDVLDKLPGSWA